MHPNGALLHCPHPTRPLYFLCILCLSAPRVDVAEIYSAFHRRWLHFPRPAADDRAHSFRRSSSPTATASLGCGGAPLHL